MSELDAISNGFRAVFDGQFIKKLTAMVLAHAAWPAISTVSREKLVELLCAPVFGVCISIDRSVTDAHRMSL